MLCVSGFTNDVMFVHNGDATKAHTHYTHGDSVGAT